jgi:hypothetical protein
MVNFQTPVLWDVTLRRWVRDYRQKSSIKPLCAPQNYQISEAFSSRGRYAVYFDSQAVQEDCLVREDGSDMLSRSVGKHLKTFF